MPKSVVIIGGSLAGLMQGIVLKRHGYNCTILEQEPSTARFSHAAGISCGPEVISFLEKYNRVERSHAIELPEIRLYRKGLKPWYTFKRQHIYSSWGLLSNILRANFDSQPNKACPSPPGAGGADGRADYRSGKRATHISYLGQKVKVEFEDVWDKSIESLEADLVIAADGSFSTTRALLTPGLRRQYVGYVSWRGTVPESELTEETLKFVENHVGAYHMKRNYLIIYTIPTDDGATEPGERLINWVWYYNYPENSPELVSCMTDVDGKRHSNTVPRGKIQPEIWDKQRAIGMATMLSPYAELISKTKTPFVTKINDLEAGPTTFYDGKLLLVGDAMAAFRPHIALSTNQSALHARLTEEWIEGKIGIDEWRAQALRYARRTALASIVIGVYGQGSVLVFVYYLAKLILLLIGQRLGLLN